MDQSPLFQGKLVKLTAPDPEKDAAVEAAWTQNLEYLRLVSSRIARPLSAGQIKKAYAELEKDSSSRCFHFCLRLAADDRLIGFLRLHHIEWNMGSAWIKLGIANPADRGKGNGSDALALGLRYAFSELNLRRLNASVAEYNLPAVELLKKFGFGEDVRRREVYSGNGRRWDGLIFGLLRSDWDERQKIASESL